MRNIVKEIDGGEGFFFLFLIVMEERVIAWKDITTVGDITSRARKLMAV